MSLRLLQLPLAARIIIGMVIGLIIGGVFQQVYFGVALISSAFIMLLQMTALPYITCSLIYSVGSLPPHSSTSAIKFALSSFIALLAIMLFFILLVPIAFPSWESASFYSANTIKNAVDVDFLELIIPKNPFHSFANAVIPAVVLFSIMTGVGLMTIKTKKATLQVVEHFQNAFAKMNALVMNLAPYGVFCIALKAAATIETSEIDGLLVYILSSSVLVIFISFILLPAIIASMTPFSYRQIIKISRAAMVTSFATGSFFGVLPTIIEKTKEALANISNEHKGVNRVAGIIVPISYSLPIGGKLIAFIFVLFAAWFSGAYISFTDYFNLIVVGLPQLFGSTIAAMPFLLDLFNVDNTLVDLYIVADNLIVSRLGALFSVVFTTSFTLLIGSYVAGKIKFDWKYVAKVSLALPIASVIAFSVLRISLESISHQYEGYNTFIERDFLLPEVKSTYLKEPSAGADLQKPFEPVLDRIKRRGFIRVGYFRDDLPYSFHNNEGKLVGFDIAIFNRLATDLNVEIEFVRIFRNQAATLLKSGYLDITSGVPLIPDNMKEFTLTSAYSEQTMAFLTKDERRAEFTDWNKILNRKDFIIGIPETFFYKKEVERVFVTGKAWEISTPRLFFKEKYAHIDAMLFGAPAASAWTLLYPEYTVVVPKPLLPPLYMAFPINKNDHAFELFMRSWIEMKKQSLEFKSLFAYWIENRRSNLILID